MYDLPQDVDFDFLKGQELILLCFSPYTLTLHFENGAHLQIEGAFSHASCTTAKKTKRYRFPIDSTGLTKLLMRKVVDIQFQRDGRLSLEFSNKDTIVIEGNTGPYEAYSVHHEGREIVV